MVRIFTISSKTQFQAPSVYVRDMATKYQEVCDTLVPKEGQEESDVQIDRWQLFELGLKAELTRPAALERHLISYLQANPDGVSIQEVLTRSLGIFANLREVHTCLAWIRKRAIEVGLAPQDIVFQDTDKRYKAGPLLKSQPILGIVDQ